ncbi:MAG: hypothetical protein FWE18_03760 [Alphaproteobacteria bacterium]|nr:hypothetical protein [Alphaproteobacteria bacterium]
MVGFIKAAINIGWNFFKLKRNEGLIKNMGAISLGLLAVSIVAGLDTEKLELIMQILSQLTAQDYVIILANAVMLFILGSLLWLSYKWIKGYGDYLEEKARHKNEKSDN